MNELALFAGAGGGILGGVLSGFRTVCAVEIDPYCQEVLLRRQEEGHLRPFPIWDDVRTFDCGPWRDCVDVVTGGFPCQPFSVAGKRLAEDDPRNLWPETIRIIREVGPRFALLENVPGLLAHEYFGTILGDLAKSGHRVGWRCLSAAEVGAPHRRDRLWIVANNDSDYRRTSWSRGAEAQSARLLINGSESRWWDADPADVVNTANAGPYQCDKQLRVMLAESASNSRRDTTGPAQPELGRVAHGVANRVDRLRALGNGQVPAVARAAWEMLSRDA